MGCYTTVLHPDNGRELQIKTGRDDLDRYRLGDTVNWRISEYFGGDGTLLDGVYDSYSDKGEDDWIIIKDHKIAAVEPRNCKYSELYEKYDIQEPDKSLWSDEAWERNKKIEEESKKRYAKWGKEADEKGLKGKERTAFLMVKPLREAMSSESIGRKILKWENK